MIITKSNYNAIIHKAIVDLVHSGSFVWNFAISNGCGNIAVRFWPIVGKAKMDLRGGSFFQVSDGFS